MNIQENVIFNNGYVSDETVTGYPKELDLEDLENFRYSEFIY